MFASDLDAASRSQLARGQRLTELLKQDQYSPYPFEEQTISVWAGTTGRLDKVPVEDVRRYEGELLDYLRREHADVLTNIRESGRFEDSTRAAAEKAVEQFARQFRTSEGKSLAGDADAEALEDDEVRQEQITRQKRG